MDTQTETAEAPTQKPLDLKVEIQEKGSCERHVTVIVPRSEIDSYFAKKFDELAPKAELPGFRVGKAPRKLLEKRFRKQIVDQVKAELLMDSLRQVQDEADFSAISEPDLEFDSVVIPDEGDLTYEFNIEVRPDFDLPQWSGLKLNRPEHEFSDKEIGAEIRYLASRFSDLVPVDEPVKSGDYVVCRIVSKHEGKVVSVEDEIKIQVKPTLSFVDATVEKFDEFIAGAVADEKRSVSVKVSEFSEIEALSGQTVDLEFEVLDVKRIELEDEDQIAAKIGFESTEELREFVEQSLFRKLQYEQRMSIRNQITEKLTASANWELPPDLLRRQSRRELERAVMEMESSGLEEGEISQRINSMKNNVLDQTATFLKEHFILERIAEEEKIEDLPGDYEVEIAKIAAQRKDSPRRVRAMLERSNQMDALRNMIIERKVIELITEKATFDPVAYQPKKDEDVVIVDFCVAGEPSSIPQAKFAGSELPPIPGTQ